MTSPSQPPPAVDPPHDGRNLNSGHHCGGGSSYQQVSQGGDEQRDPPSSQLGFQSPSSGVFPKISSNFDKVRKIDSTSPAHVQRISPTPAADTPPRKTDALTGNFRAPKLSFAEAAARRAAKPPDLFVHNLQSIQPVRLNDDITVIIPPDMYEARLKSFQFALIGRLALPPGAAPRGGEELKRELTALFGTTTDWILMPLAKGFFSLKFLLIEDKVKASRMTSWKLAVGSLQIRDWKPNFNPYKEPASTAQVWVRLFHLPAEYWHPEFLVGIFRAVGNVIKLDGNTAYGLVGHFARALVDIDLNQPVLDSIRVGLPDNLLSVDFRYENIPLLCSFCKFVGHSAEKCRKAKAKEKIDKASLTDKKQQAANQVHPKQCWVEKPRAEIHSKLDTQSEGVATSNHFDALHEEGVPETDMSDSGEGPVIEKVDCPPHDAPDTDRNFTKDNLQSTDDDEEIVGETHFQSPADLLDSVTVSVDNNTTKPAAISEKARRRLIARVRQLARQRQLRSKIKSGARTSDQAMDKGVAVQSDSEPQENMEVVPAAMPADAPAAVEDSKPPDDAPAAVDDAPAAVTTGTEGQPLSSKPTEPEAAATAEVADATASVAAENTPVEAPPPQHISSSLPPSAEKEASAPKAGFTKKSKSKRKAKEIPQTTRQLRSSTNSGAFQALVDKRHRSFQVPADLAGQSKETQLAPNSPHPKQAQLDKLLRAAIDLGKHPTAYVIDTGQSDALKAMDLVAMQHWGDITNSEAVDDSDDYV